MCESEFQLRMWHYFWKIIVCFFLPQMIGNCGSNTKIAVLDFVFGSLNHFREHMYFNCASFWTQIESCLR